MILWDCREKAKLWYHSFAFSLTKSSAISSNNNITVCSTMNGVVTTLDIRTMKRLNSFSFGYEDQTFTTRLRFSLDDTETILFSGDQNNYVRTYDLQGGKLVNWVGPFKCPVLAVAFQRELELCYKSCFLNYCGHLRKPSLIIPEETNLQLYGI